MTHICTCLGLVNRGIICRHFFQIMLCSNMVRFYISFIPSRWYCDKHPDPYEQLYYIAQKFNKGQLLGKPLTKAANGWYLPESDHSQHNYKIINERQFYGELWGVAQSITQKALKKQDHTVIEKLQNILEELATTDEDNEEDEDDEEDEENEEHEEDDNDEVPFDLQNPQRKPKRGRPKDLHLAAKFFEKLSNNYLELLDGKENFNIVINVGESPNAIRYTQCFNVKKL
ncbi:hypothetical protein C2G38_2139514 [Gigaspora rosea]|uniref:SWIM-type domain-containing protein n=1 Tax=Gigaspora rosea TaxID=44941 RepID=A0A397VS95_9GLOM|nr:hypothetical protein C2G38_2139514 [Gigaspora rosea]